MSKVTNLYLANVNEHQAKIDREIILLILLRRYRQSKLIEKGLLLDSVKALIIHRDKEMQTHL